MRALFVSFAVLGACVTPPSFDAGIDSGTEPPDSGEADAGAVDSGAPDAGGEVDAGPPQRVLFVGNSYTYVNDVPGHYRAAVGNATVEMVAPGGYRLTQHWADAQTDGTALARWLRTGTAAETAFDAVVLQEQSQIGGFPVQLGERVASIAGAAGLTQLAHARGASVVLYLTWGYERGDPPNDLLGYGTYSGMQDALDDGYLNLAASLREQGGDVRLAPVGGGFRIVFEDVTKAGLDPLAEGSDFDALYEADGSHPSLRGAYLAACIIAGTATSAAVRGFPDEPDLGAAVSASLRDVCARALADPRWHVPQVLRPQQVLKGALVSATFFGRGVALSADGTHALVHDRVYVRGDAGWVEDSRVPVAGAGVGLTSDGRGAFVAGRTSATLFARGAAGWSEDTTLAYDGGPNCTFVSDIVFRLSADGNRAFIGQASCSTGGMDVFFPPRVRVREAGGWVDEAELAVPYLQLDGTGERAIAGLADGGVSILKRTGSSWAGEATLPGRGVGAISSDGTRALVGRPAAKAMMSFARSGTTWSEEAPLRVLSTGSSFGGCYVPSGDGRRVAVCAPSDSPVATGAFTGSVKIYELRDGGYRQRFLLVPSDGKVADSFGSSVAMSADGKSVLVGAPNTDGEDGGTVYEGTVYAFTLP